VTVVKMQTQRRQIVNRSTISKFSIISPLSKNKITDEFAFKRRQGLDKIDKSTLQNHINTTQKQTKSFKSAHKLHSLHRSYNKL
jgi:hypothetical protein